MTRTMTPFEMRMSEPMYGHMYGDKQEWQQYPCVIAYQTGERYFAVARSGNEIDLFDVRENKVILTGTQKEVIYDSEYFSDLKLYAPVPSDGVFTNFKNLQKEIIEKYEKIKNI